MNTYSGIINNHLEKLIDRINSENPLKEYMSYALFPSGKYLRSSLCLSTHSMYSPNPNEILDLACCIELIHNYSLVHDDLPSMDNDDYRRGRLTVHKKYGEANAILTGDALLNYAYKVAIKDIIASDNKERKLKALETIAERAGHSGMIYGQILDIKDAELSKDELHYMYARKTGDLIAAAVLAGSIVGGADEKELVVLKSFADSLGLFFQVRDDIGDYDEDKKIGKQTLISGKSKSEACDIMKNHADDCLGYLKELAEKYNRDTSKLGSIINSLLDLTL
ncbi:MAG: polyprenyl synthetase family protein [Candidatus Riflebacteria bacterium]|nr:polyprenyl synthetase family protein [Candidatus Riflebacteria bacterium]